MDTTESLRAQLELAQKIEWGNGEDGDDEKLARLVLDLHARLINGEMLPVQWRTKSMVAPVLQRAGGCLQCKRGVPAWPGRICDACHEAEVRKSEPTPSADQGHKARFSLIELE